MEVTVDGGTPTSLSLTDQNGSAQSNSIDTSSSTTFYQHTEWFFGLDGQEHVIVITNNDSGSAALLLDFIEVGFKTPRPTTDLTVTYEPGTASVRGSVASISGGTATFTASSGHGHTAALVSDTSGTVTAVDGVEPAFTQLEPETAVSFSSAVTSLSVKNANPFPSSGVCLYQDPYGYKTFFSYSGKTDSAFGSHSLTGIVWDAQPSTDFTPLNGFDSTTTGNATGDATITLWAEGAHTITSSNHDIDFAVTLNGTRTTHTATVASGVYGADLVKLGDAVVDALLAAKTISNAEYFCEYDADQQRWSVGTRGSEVSLFELLNSSGSNSADSIMTNVLGFASSDLTTSTSYQGTSDVQSLARRAFRADPHFASSDDPRIKYNSGSGSIPAQLNDIRERIGLGNLRLLSAGGAAAKIFVDDDACGVTVSIADEYNGGMISFQVDGGQIVYAYQSSGTAQDTGSSTRANIGTFFIPFPRGSKVVSIFLEDQDMFELRSVTPEMVIVGFRQYFSRPKLESLTKSQAVLKSFDIAPKLLFKTLYADDYSPGSNDNIDTITYTGTWTAASSDTSSFNQQTSTTTTQNDTLDVTFTTTGDGGGIGIMLVRGSGSLKLEFYLTEGASASESGTLIQVINTNNGSALYDTMPFEILGLDAGQYTLRLKNAATTTNDVDVQAIGITDTAQPDDGYTVGDLNNSDQGISYPLHVKHSGFNRDMLDRTPAWLERSGYKEGVAVGHYQANSISALNYENSGNVRNVHGYYGSASSFGGTVTATYFEVFGFMQAVASYDGANTGNNTTVRGVLNGIDSPSNYSQRVQVNSGSAPTARQSFSPLFQKYFYQLASGNMSDSTTFLVSDTRGIIVGMEVIISADSQTTLKRTVATVTAGTNFTITEAISGFANYTTANNAAVTFANFQAVRLRIPTDNNNFYPGSLGFVPLPISPSNDNRRRMAQSKNGEVKTITFFGVSTNDDLFYPIFDDGVSATWNETTIDLIGHSSASLVLDINTDLKNIQTGTGTADIKLTSVRSRNG
jgi:hypothetical protein